MSVLWTAQMAVQRRPEDSDLIHYETAIKTMFSHLAASPLSAYGAKTQPVSVLPRM